MSELERRLEESLDGIEAKLPCLVVDGNYIEALNWLRDVGQRVQDFVAARGLSLRELADAAQPEEEP